MEGDGDAGTQGASEYAVGGGGAESTAGVRKMATGDYDIESTMRDAVSGAGSSRIAPVLSTWKSSVPNVTLNPSCDAGRDPEERR
jgi:hypothetical protein